MGITSIVLYGFIVNALIVGVLVSVCSSLLGVTLVLKRYSMIGDGLSHVGFGALSVAMALGFSPLYLSVPVVIAAAFLLLRLGNNGKIKGDAAIALISTGSLSVGIIATSLAKGGNVDVLGYMFGSIFAMSDADLILSIGISIAVLLSYIFFYNKIFVVTFDEDFARASGIRVEVYKLLIALLTAVTIVVGMRIMGTMLISSLIIFPALTSMRIFGSFRAVIISSALVSVVCFVVGIVFSFAFNLPAGASVVAANGFVFVLFYAISLMKKVKSTQ